MNAREEMLSRIRAARSGATVVEPERGNRLNGEHPPGAAPLLDLLEDRLVDYKAAVHRCDAAGLPAAVAAALEAAEASADVVVPAGLDPSWVPGGRVDGGGLTAAELDRCSAVVTACRAACAETGTIVLDGAPDQGRRAISLVPDVHVCVVRAEQVVQTVPELLSRLEPTRPMTFISGPSATSDIELDRVEGVHGPRTLAVVLVV